MSIHDGHRMRIIEKIDKNILKEHEYLEILLFNAIPRRNTNDIAHRLLAKFGSIPNMFAASLDELQSVEGVGPSVAAYLKCIGVFFEKYHPVKDVAYRGVFERETFLTFMKNRYKEEKNEIFDIYFLDGNKKVFAEERFTSFQPNTASIAPEGLSKSLAMKMPAGIILVHNHPFGKAEPSTADDDATKRCQTMCNMQNILLCDHLIYGQDGIYSYYSAGRLQEINESVLEIIG